MVVWFSDDGPHRPFAYMATSERSDVCVCAWQSLRNTTPVPRHWSQKRKYLQVRTCCRLNDLSHDCGNSRTLCIHRLSGHVSAAWWPNDCTLTHKVK